MTEDKEDKTVQSPGYAGSNVIFEQVGNGCYVVYDKAEGKFQALNDPQKFYHNCIEHVPLPRLPWPSVTLPKEYQNEEQLFNEIKEFFIRHLDVANDLFFDVYACFVLASWRTEDFKVVPYLFFLGPLASGKTRALECFFALCHRARECRRLKGKHETEKTDNRIM